MNFINNQGSNTHLASLLENLKGCEKAFFATAFLKVSGLNKLIRPLKEFLKSGNQITIIAGQNFAITEPTALHSLRKLFKTFPSSKLYLARADAANSIFHPKLYLFKAKKNCCIISGSANIIEGD